MEQRAIILITATALVIVACTALAAGHIQLAEDANAAWATCEAKYRKRVADLSRIEIRKNEITYRGELVATVESVLRDDSPTFLIDSLLAKLERDRSRACDPTWICLDNLVVLQFDAIPDSRLLGKLANTVWAANYDFVHVTRTGGW
ncbi:MAG TPA: hypothetical protein VFO79_12625 [Xanthomonadales bacterium]|nr:hypothetical protein [Xanthomonadales bacterium]